MATVSELRDAIAKNLGTIKGLRTSGFVPDNPNPPQAIVEPTSINSDTTMGRGLDEFNFTVNIIVGRVSDRTSQANLDAYCSSSGAMSVKSAVESDRTLSGYANDCRVAGLTSYGSVSIGENTYLAAEFAVRVYAN